MLLNEFIVAVGKCSGRHKPVPNREFVTVGEGSRRYRDRLGLDTHTQGLKGVLNSEFFTPKFYRLVHWKAFESDLNLCKTTH